MNIERLGWAEFTDRIVWRQGEHVSLIGPTGAGKTTLAYALLPLRRFATVFGTKPSDSTLEALIRRQDWTRIHEWSERPPMIDAGSGPAPMRLALWPKFNRMSDAATHRAIFREALHEMFAERSWSMFADEVMYLSNDLGLGPELKQIWRQGRSIKLSLMAATQRPAWVPLELYSQATHLFLWRTTDRRDLERLRDISGPVDARGLMEAVSALDFWKFEVLYVNTRTGEVLITSPPKV